MIVGQDFIKHDCDQIYEAFRRQRYRTMREFAEQEIIIPSGEYEGRRFLVDRQPISGLWFREVDNPNYIECVITGPSQSGKTLIGFVIPVLYHLFERVENVVAAVPDYEMVNDKWNTDILPALERTRFARHLPNTRVSSRQSLVEFGNGAKLRWMTAGGSDKSRAGFTARVVCMTETDAFDARASTSDEADKIEQIEARLRSYSLLRRRIYKECTVSVSEGHTWQRYTSGTHSQIMLRCPHCKEWVKLERENFAGWQHATTDVDAVASAAFFCSACGEEWTEDQRAEANRNALLVHRGQKIEDNQVVNDPPKTYTLGFRWSAVNNLLVPAADLGRDEFKAARAVDEDNEERKMCQFVWCQPYIPKDLEEVPLTVEVIQDRAVEGAGRGVCPEGTRWVTIGVDVNRPVLHWTAIAWVLTDETFAGRIIDYGKQGVKDDDFNRAVAKLKAKFGVGWVNTPAKIFNRVVIDARWSTTEIVKAVQSLRDNRWRPFMGMGQGHWKRRTYRHPDTSKGKWVGNACYEKLVPTHKCRFMMADANFWKTWLHSHLVSADNQTAGCLTLFATTDDKDRLNFARHLTAEKERIRYEQGKGYIKEWESIRSANHWLDSTYMACVAGNRFWHGHIDRARRPRRVASTAGNRQPRQARQSQGLSLGGRSMRLGRNR